MLKVGSADSPACPQRESRRIKEMVLNRKAKDWVNQIRQSGIEQLAIFESCIDRQVELGAWNEMNSALELLKSHICSDLDVRVPATGAERKAESRPNLVINPLHLEPVART